MDENVRSRERRSSKKDAKNNKRRKQQNEMNTKQFCLCFVCFISCVRVYCVRSDHFLRKYLRLHQFNSPEIRKRAECTALACVSDNLFQFVRIGHTPKRTMHPTTALNGCRRRLRSPRRDRTATQTAAIFLFLSASGVRSHNKPEQ